MKLLNYKDKSRDKTHDVLSKLKSKWSAPEARRITIANSSLRGINEAPVDDPEY